MGILQQGQQYMGGTVQYDAATGKKLGTNEITVENKDLTATGQNPDMSKFNIPQSSAITPSALTHAQPKVPFVTNPTPIPDVSHLAPPSVDPSTVPSQLTPSEQRKKEMIDQLMGTNTALEGKNTYTAQQNEALGVNAASDAITGLNSQLTGLINESKAIPLAIQQNAQQGGANVTKGGLAPIQTAQLRNNAIQSLAVSSQIDAMNGQLSNAIKKVDRAVALKYGDLEARSATLTKNLELLSKDPSLTLEQQDRVAKKLAEQKKYDTALADQKKVETDTHDSILKTLSNNSGNPKLTQQAVAALQAATTPEEVAALVNYFGLSTLSQQEQATLRNVGAFELSAGQSRFDANGKLIASVAPTKIATSGGTSVGGVASGSTTRDAESVMNGTLNLQDISVKDNYRAGVAAELAKKQKEALSSGDMAGVMRASAAYDKEPSDTFLQSMEKTLAVVSQLGVLQENIAGTNTGPIVGAFRGLNPWDTNAQTIKAQLNAIVPNLARGVYGEVGVLTDNDIKQYAKTIPTLTSTEDIRNAILYITLNQIRKNVQIKIENQASGQRDMSGYANVYANLDEQVQSVLNTLPKAPANNTTPLKTGSAGQTSSGIKWTIE